MPERIDICLQFCKGLTDDQVREMRSLWDSLHGPKNKVTTAQFDRVIELEDDIIQASMRCAQRLLEFRSDGTLLLNYQEWARFRAAIDALERHLEDTCKTDEEDEDDDDE